MTTLDPKTTLIESFETLLEEARKIRIDILPLDGLEAEPPM